MPTPYDNPRDQFYANPQAAQAWAQSGGDQSSYNGIQNYNNDPYSGMPTYPAYNKVYDPATMNTFGMNPNTQALEAYRSNALRTGASPWANLATAKSYADERAARDALTNQNASAQATARSNLAMHGGLRSGAAERVATQGNRDLYNASTDLAKQGIGNRQQIGINDEQNRITQLGSLPGMETQNAEFNLNRREYDINNALNENARQNAYNLGVYKTQGDIWGAGKQAQATANSGGSWICTEAKKRATKDPEWTPRDAKALKKFQRYAMLRHCEGARFYVYKCNELIKRMDAAGDVDWKEVLRFVRLIVHQAHTNQMNTAFVNFVKYVRDLIDKYWPDCDNPVYLSIKKQGASVCQELTQVQTP